MICFTKHGAFFFFGGGVYGKFPKATVQYSKVQDGPLIQLYTGLNIPLQIDPINIIDGELRYTKYGVGDMTRVINMLYMVKLPIV